MAQIAHEDSSVSWSGTFGYILLPGLSIGLLPGWAEHLRRTGGRLACGVLVLTAIPLWALTVESFAGADLAITTPRGLWVAFYYYYLALLWSLLPSRTGPQSTSDADRRPSTSDRRTGTRGTPRPVQIPELPQHRRVSRRQDGE